VTARAACKSPSASVWTRLRGAIGVLRPHARWIGLTLGVAIVSISIAVLVHLLRDLQPSEIIVALKER
jgi:hypothetical protein